MDDMRRQALILVGYIYLGCGKTEKAVSLLEAARAKAPGDPYLCRALSFAYIRTGRYERALGEAEKCLAGLKAAPQDRRCALLLKAHALWGLGRETERKRTVEELFALGARTESAHE